MSIIAQMQEFHGWDYRIFLWIGSMLLVLLILFLAAIAVFLGRARSQEQLEE